VEEGVPVGSVAANELLDQSMSDVVMDDDMGTTGSSTPQQQQLLHFNTTNEAARSSLQSACRGKPFRQRTPKMHATRVVIGGESFDTSTSSYTTHELPRIYTTQQMHIPSHQDNPFHLIHGHHVSGTNHYHQQQQQQQSAYTPHAQRQTIFDCHNHSYPPTQPHQTHIEISDRSSIHLASQASMPPAPPSSHHPSQNNSHVLSTYEQSSISTHNNYNPAASRSFTRQHRSPSSGNLPAVQTRIEIGVDDRPTERMEGVEDHSIKPPLIVLDGANLAYAYTQALRGGPPILSSSGRSAASTRAAYNSSSNNNKLQPDARGIQVACEYFQSAGMRVLVVIPQSWFRNSTNPQSSSTTLLDGLYELQQSQGPNLVAAPPTDDDDAYVLMIAQRENLQRHPRPNHHHHQSDDDHTPWDGQAFVLSNDLYRDAAARDETGHLQDWLKYGSRTSHPADHRSSNANDVPGRISFAFCDLGSMDDHGDKQLDFVPNPRHPLVVHIETRRLLQARGHN
jgi:hypothetical protein